MVAVALLFALLTPCFLQQWIDLARATGVQSTKKELPSPEIPNSTETRNGCGVAACGQWTGHVYFFEYAFLWQVTCC